MPNILLPDSRLIDVVYFKTIAVNIQISRCIFVHVEKTTAEICNSQLKFPNILFFQIYVSIKQHKCLFTKIPICIKSQTASYNDSKTFLAV